MKMKREIDRALSGVQWTQADSRAVLNRIERKRAPMPARRVAALAVAAVLLLCGAGYAVGATGLLDQFFPDGDVRPEAGELLTEVRLTETIDGAVFTIEEALYDGEALNLLVTVRNDTDAEMQVCFSEPKLDSQNPLGGWIDGPFDEFCPIAPGETLTGTLHAVYEENGETCTVSTTCKVLAEDGEVRFTHMSFAVSRGEAAEMRPVESEFELPGYVLRVTGINFAPGSSRITFDVIPEDPVDTVFEMDGACGRLYRWYAVLDETGEDLRLTREGVCEFGRNEDGTLSYVFLFNPLPDVPEYVTIVPISGGEYMMEEAVAVRIEG